LLSCFATMIGTSETRFINRDDIMCPIGMKSENGKCVPDIIQEYFGPVSENAYVDYETESEGENVVKNQ